MRLAAIAVFVLSVGTFAAGAGTVALLGTYLLQQVDSELGNIAVGLRGTSIDLGTVVDSSTSRPYYLALFDPNGKVVGESRSSEHSAPRLSGTILEFLKKPGNFASAAALDGSSDWRLVAVPVKLTGSNVELVLVVGHDLSETSAIQARCAAIFLIFGLTAVIVGSVVTYLLVRSTLAPLRDLEAKAVELASGNFSQRLPGEEVNTEIGRLTLSLNKMLEQVQTAFADRTNAVHQMERFADEASRDLRTPLIAVQSDAERYRRGDLQLKADLDGAMACIEGEAVRMGVLVDELLKATRILDDSAKP